MANKAERLFHHQPQQRDIEILCDEVYHIKNGCIEKETKLEMEGRNCMVKRMDVNNRNFSIIKLLGKGKGGYSYLASDQSGEYVLKQIHHEPCDYYQFGNKMEAELRDYKKLKSIGIAMPALLDWDSEKERILKEYIEGDTIYDLVMQDKMKKIYLEQVQDMCRLLYAANTNIDYFPTNFVVQQEKIYYIDYECNDYMEEWNFENWGIKYWSKTPEFLKYAKEHDENEHLPAE